ncbi:MAG: phosphate/phosphite/phosphonate ABC transporter substrate-binding protein [bacterium]
MRKYKKRFICHIMVILIIFSFIGCRKSEKLKEVDFKDTVKIKEAQVFSRPEINICVGSMITPEEGYAHYKRMLDYIGKKLDMKVNFVEKRSYNEVNALLKNGNIDVAFVCGGPYVAGREEFNLELLVAPMVEGRTIYYSYIIVGRDSPIVKFEQLKGKVFAFVDPMSNTGKLVPTYMVNELGKTPDEFFKEYLYTYGHDSSIKAVAQGIVDGAAVDSLIWDYMDKKDNKYTKQTKIIKISDPYGIPPVVVRPGIDEKLKNKIKNIFLNIHNDKEGQDILQEMFIDRFVEVDDSIYDTIRDIKTRIGE